MMILFLRSLRLQRLQRLLLLLIVLFGWVSVWVLIFGKLFFYPAMFCLLAVLIYICLSNWIELKGKTLPSENLFNLCNIRWHLSSWVNTQETLMPTDVHLAKRHFLQFFRVLLSIKHWFAKSWLSALEQPKNWWWLFWTDLRKNPWCKDFYKLSNVWPLVFGISIVFV